MKELPFEYVAEGTLEKHPLPVLLNLALNRNLSGLLHIESGEAKTWIYFEQGFPAAVHIPNSEVFLGMIMREMGLIDDATFNESLMIMAKTNQLHGQVLIDMGKINQEQLVQAHLAQLMRKLTELFVLRSGNFRFEDGAQIPSRQQPSRIHPYQVILNGIRNSYQKEDLAISLGALLEAKSCKVSEKYQEHQGLLELPAEEQADLARLDEYRLPEEFVKSAKCGQTAAMMVLLTLACCGLLDIAESRKAEPFEKKKVEKKPEPAPKPVPAGQLKELQQALKAKIDQIKETKLLDLLEVPRDFDAEQLKKSFISLSKRFHPDRLSKVADDDFKRVANFVFAKINEAYGTLSDPKSRDAYLKTVPLAPGEKRRADPEGALVAYEKAKVFINKKMHPLALEQLQMAHELDPGVAEYHARYIWYGYVCAEEPREEKLQETRKRLLKLFDEYPGNFYINRYLTNAFKLLKDQENYERHLLRANSIRPTDIDTARELRLHNSRKEKGGKKGGLFSLTRKK
jgi:tetratricopeptide (TPR) repeat protein